MPKTFIYIGAGVVILLVVLAGVWFFFFRPQAPAQTSSTSSFDSVTNNNLTSVSGGQPAANTNGTQAVSQTQPVTQQKIFAVAQGPVVGATLIETSNPTTTLARYIGAQDGHVYDLPLDVPGAVPRVISNVTIPGGYRAVWLEGGSAVAMQYLENGIIKTVYMGFSASSTLPTRVQFLPDNIEDLAASPNGKSLAYLLTTSSGSDGYVAASNGAGAKKLFSLPLSQVTLSWPASGTLLATSKAAAGVPGVALAVDVKSGIVSPLVYAQGLTAIADNTFTHVIYQTIQSGGALAFSYLHNVKTGANNALSFSPSPENCIEGSAATIFYCASPLQYVGPNFLDQWHMGLASAADALFAFNIASSTDSILASPGSADGGTQADIFQLAVSPDDHYLLYVTKGDRSLWGVRLAQ